MKKLFLISVIAITGILAASCGASTTGPEDTGGDDTQTPTVKLVVSSIADNKATLSATVEKGSATKGKVVAGVRISSVNVDYTKEIPLISYVEANGTDISMPYTTELTGLINEQDYFCAVIIYDSTGRACSSAYYTFTAIGEPEGISNENSAGNLEDNPQ